VCTRASSSGELALNVVLVSVIVLIVAGLSDSQGTTDFQTITHIDNLWSNILQN
jgi:hypothetical protein